ncbi:MAG: hypothetical protein NVSMB48_04480 [Marmoricola sp.]
MHVTGCSSAFDCDPIFAFARRRRDAGATFREAYSDKAISATASQGSIYAGFGSAAIDSYQCVSGASNEACFGAVAGAASAYCGLATLGRDASALTVFLNAHGFVLGGIAYGYDLYDYLEQLLGAPC